MPLTLLVGEGQVSHAFVRGKTMPVRAYLLLERVRLVLSPAADILPCKLMLLFHMESRRLSRPLA